MRHFITFFLILISSTLKAQIYTTSEMYVHFFSPAPIADIEAISNTAEAKLNLAKKEIEIEIPVNSFTFKKALMQTHFNEKYIESDKYPKASFQGKYKDNLELKKDGVYALELTGKFNIHGVSRTKTVSCIITVKNQRIVFETSFKLLSADYKIKAPDVIYRRVGQEVSVDASGILVSMVR